jgi:hypothetical protein
MKTERPWQTIVTPPFCSLSESFGDHDRRVSVTQEPASGAFS